VRHSNAKSRARNLGILLVFLFSAAQVAQADFVFGAPENLGPVINSSVYEGAGHGFSDDGLSLAFVRQPSGANYVEGYLATRPTIDSPWEAPENHGVIDDLETAFIRPDVRVCFTELMSPDGLEAYFGSTRAGGYGGVDIWMMERGTPKSEWESPVNLGPTVNSTGDDWQIVLSPDGLELYFCDDSSSPRPGGLGSVDLWVTKRTSIGEPWTEPVNLGPAVNSSGWDSAPYLSSDGLLLFFDSDRSAGYGSWDLYVSKRASLSDPWEQAVNLGPVVNSSSYDETPQLSADGLTLYWGSRRPGGYGGVDIWQSPVIPIVDFNGDGGVDCGDICDLVDHWGSDNSLYDIGPTPFGDGVVDAQDLIVLAEHMAADANNPNDIE
jgi:hypothetical protein